MLAINEGIFLSRASKRIHYKLRGLPNNHALAIPSESSNWYHPSLLSNRDVQTRLPLFPQLDLINLLLQELNRAVAVLVELLLLLVLVVIFDSVRERMLI